MAFLQGTTGRLHVRSWPVPRPRAAVVLLHGLGEHAGLYEFLAGELGRAGLELWVPDHHGHGHSDGERVLVRGLDVLQDDAELVLAHVAGQRPGVPLVLAGHSLGAVTAALLVAERGVRPVALVLSALTLGSTDVLEALVADGVDPLSLSKDPGELSRNAGYAQQLRDDPLTWQGGIRVETIEALRTVRDRMLAVPTAAPPDLPVLLLHGAADDLAPVDAVRGLAGSWPAATLRVYPDDLHNVLNEIDRDAVAADVVAFVDRALAALPRP